MTRPRQLLLGLGVVALLAVVAVASSGRPLSSSRGSGPSVRFFDYVFTTLLVGAVAITVIVLYALTQQRAGPFTPHRRRWHLLSTFAGILAGAAIALAFLHSNLAHRLQSLDLTAHRADQHSADRRNGKQIPGARNAQVRWDEIAIVLVLLAGCGVLLVATRRTKTAPRAWRLGAHESVSLALDESLDDLRTEPDLRRAIIAAYARMERALGDAGIPRHPAEAPFEYVERALGELETSDDSAHRLTALFEWAKFSQHEPAPEMRDDAIDALVAIRDELLRPAEPALA